LLSNQDWPTLALEKAVIFYFITPQSAAFAENIFLLHGFYCSADYSINSMAYFYR
jgi:hypothetical protein